MKQTPSQFYASNIEKHSEERKQLQRQLAASSLIRLLLFVALCVAAYFTFPTTALFIGVLLAGILLFVFLVTRHNRLQYKKKLKEALIEINETELTVLNRQFHHLPDGSEYKDATHFFSQDIDLFGRGSFYQYLNRTSLKSGADTLARLLTQNTTEAIEQKQKAMEELSNVPEWRQRFSAIASLVATEVSAASVVRWLDSYKPFVFKGIKWISLAFSIISVSLFVTYFFGFISGYVVFGWFLLGLAISGRYLKKVNELASHTAKIQSTFEQFHKLMEAIEQQEFNSQLLSEKSDTEITKSQKASTAVKRFARHLDALDQRNNMLIGVLANGFMLRDLRQSHNIEKWIATYGDHVATWFTTISFFDAYNSLANYCFNHPEHVFPTIQKTGPVLQLTNAAHPLLPPDTAVANNLQIEEEAFFIVTGANMAGKSTFLRTVALQIVLGNVGLPTNAEAANYRPIKLITSMRTTDSLTDDESYFFSELKRLKFIVDAIKTDRYFIILDEILKGTNSTDKAIGSKKFVEKLVRGNATGIIATHDLSLCEVAETLPDVSNYYFDARIEDGELYFDYTFKPGICKNMNASFLLKKMQIVD